MKTSHEFRDPIHGFITCSSMERAVIDSAPFQRLRNIHQLAMTYLVYPGATHRRFEHSLGVMDLASKVFNIITKPENILHLPEEVMNSIPELTESRQIGYWDQTLRMAALCHDLGHLPFSHGAEELLPPDYNHERMTWEIIHSEQMSALLQKMTLNPTSVAKLAIGQKDLVKFSKERLTTWESLLAEIIVGDAFGVDRMDYLLRDSYHLGVSYGNFDIKRLIHGLRIVYKPSEGTNEKDISTEPYIGVERGSLHVAASLLWARYSIFSQVYFHHVRRIYDIHLQDFIKSCFPECYPVDLDKFIAISDNNILVDLNNAASDTSDVNHHLAKRIQKRNHFRLVYRQSHSDRKINIEALDTVYNALCENFDSLKLRCDHGTKKHKILDFPVIDEVDAKQVSMASLEMPSINQVPNVEAGYIFADPEIRDNVNKFLSSSRYDIIREH